MRGLHPRPLDERAGGFHCTERDLSRSPHTLTELVAPGVRRIPIPLPIRGLSIVNAYLVEGARGWSLVDAGLHTADAEQALRAGLADAGIGIEDLKRVFVTHLHPDHIGMAGTLERAGAEVLMHTPEIGAAQRIWSKGHEAIDATYDWFVRHGMPRDIDEGMRQAWIAMADRVDDLDHVAGVDDGDALDLGGRATRLRWTPGHTDYHAVLIEERDGLLFAGDHVLPRITSNIGLYPSSRDDPLGDFLGALARVRDLPVKRVLPAHGDPFDDLAGRVDELLAHHAARLEATIAAVGTAERDAYTIARRLFPVLRSAHEERFALAETLAHLRYLERNGRVREVDGSPARWRVT
ncbi:MAG TPA: MBL fold metallo-hydrolase [Candidatus Limnocylindria bacterium]|nr:MBL fold metallo-hydrolase [Candidatus Limnocylindria bacterium]